MGLDQYLYTIKPNLLEPGSNSGEEIDYWRKDWDLQTYLGTDNCEELVLTEAICQDVLTNLDHIYSENTSHKDHTRKAFTQALKFIKSGTGVIYDANW